MRIAAIIVSYNTRPLLLEALRSLEDSRCDRVVVVDNSSTDGSPDAVALAFPWVSLIRSERNLGFAAGVNQGVQAAGDAEALLLLNPDARLTPGALDQLSAWLRSHPRAAAVGAALVYGDGRPQESAFRFPGLTQVFLDLFPVPRLASSRLNGRYGPRTLPFRVDHPLGACLLIRRAAWEDVGPLDERFFMYVEEVDWCRRAKARGWEVWSHPAAVAVHLAAQSTGQRPDAMFVALWRSRLRYYAKHHGRTYLTILRLLVRLGMRSGARRACRMLRGDALAARLQALEAVRVMAR